MTLLIQKQLHLTVTPYRSLGCDALVEQQRISKSFNIYAMHVACHMSQITKLLLIKSTHKVMNRVSSKVMMSTVLLLQMMLVLLNTFNAMPKTQC